MRGAIRLAGAVVVLGFWVWYFASNWHILWSYPWEVVFPPLLLAVVLWSGYSVFMAIVWMVAETRCGGGLPFVTGLWIWVSTMPARHVPGNIWHIGGRLYKAAQVGASLDSILVSSTVEQVLTVAGELVVFVVLLPLWPNLPSSGLLAPLVAVPIGLLALHPLVLGRILNLVSRLLRRPMATVPLSYSQLLLLLLCYTGVALLNGVAFFLAAISLDAAAMGHLSLLVGGYLLARALGFLSFVTPAGLGVREAVLVALLAPYWPLPLITVMALLGRVLPMIGEAVAVLVVGAVKLRYREAANEVADGA